MIRAAEGAAVAVAVIAATSGCAGSEVRSDQPTNVEHPSTATSTCGALVLTDPTNGRLELEAPNSHESLFALVFGPYPVRGSTGVTKIAWRMTGTGPLSLRAVDPLGRAVALAWGPEAHTASSWSRPGQEWGSGFKFSTPGCWTVIATRGADATSIGLLVD